MDDREELWAIYYALAHLTSAAFIHAHNLLYATLLNQLTEQENALEWS